MNQKTKETIADLESIRPSLTSQDPIARAIAMAALKELGESSGITPEQIAEASAAIDKQNARTRPQPGADRVPATPESIAKFKEQMKAAKRDFYGVDLTERDYPTKLWALWHTRARTVIEDDTAFMVELYTVLGCHICQAHFIVILRTLKPRFGAGYFAYTVDFHNAVNDILKKPILTLEQAEALYPIQAVA